MSSSDNKSKMTAKIAPNHSHNASIHRQSSITLLDRVLDSVTCCSSEHTDLTLPSSHHNPTIAAAAPPINGEGEAILPHLRFRPINAAHNAAIDNRSHSNIIDFYNLFLKDDAPHSFLGFHAHNGDAEVCVGKWRPVDASNDNGTTRLQRTISFVTKISNDSISNIPIGVVNTQTLIMDGDITSSDAATTSSSLRSSPPSTCALESRIHFDFEGGTAVLKGMGQFLISNDVRGSEVVVRVILREGDTVGSGVLLNADAAAAGNSGAGQSSKDATTSRNQEDTILEKEKDSFFSCFSHPLLMPEYTLCGSSTTSSKQKESNTGGWIKKSNSFVDLHGERSLSQEGDTTSSHASHVGASLLSAIQAKNNTNGSSSKSSLCWSSASSKTMRTRFDNLSPSFASPTEHPDVLTATSSRGTLKHKPVPNNTFFELTRASSTKSTDGHLAMRRLILEKDGAMTTNTKSIVRSTSSSHNSKNHRGIVMRIEMNITSPSSNHASSASSFSRSKGSFTNLDIKIRRNLKKRVSRSWISWAESWCMRLWEEEESRLLSTTNRVAVENNGRKRKTNVRPVVRRISEKSRDNEGSGNRSKNVSLLNWNAMEVDNAHQWTFVRQSTDDTLEEECGVEVACTAELNVKKVARTMKEEEEEIVQKLPAEEEKKEGSGKLRWNRSPQVKKRIGR